MEYGVESDAVQFYPEYLMLRSRFSAISWESRFFCKHGSEGFLKYNNKKFYWRAYRAQWW